MTPDALRAAITLTDGRLDLATATLDDDGLTRDLGETFTLTGASSTDTDDGVTVTGTAATGRFAGMTVTARFTAASGTEVVGTAGPEWAFTPGFPEVAGGVFDSLRFTAPTLTRKADGGFDFAGTLIVTTPMAVLDLIADEHPVTGRIDIFTQIPDVPDFTITPAPQIALYGPQNGTADLGLFQVTGLAYAIFGDVRLDYNTADTIVRTSLVINGAIPFTTYGQPRQIPIGAAFDNWGSAIRFTADLSDAGRAAFSDIAAFLRQDDLSVPGALEVTAPILPTEFACMVDPAGTDKIAYVSLSMETQEEWTIVPGLLMQAVDLDFRIDSPLSSPSVQVNISGLLAVGEYGTLELTTGFGTAGGSIGGELRTGDKPLSIREVYTDFTGDDTAEHLPDLAVTTFEFGAVLPTETTSLAADAFIELEGGWQITDSVSLAEVQFGLDTDGQNARFVAGALLDIASVFLRLTARYDTATGWTFQGGTLPGVQVPIGELADELVTSYGAAPLPAPLHDLTVHDVSASFSTVNTRFAFTAAVRFPIDTTTVDLSVAIDTAARTYGGRIEVTTSSGLVLDFDAHFATQAAATRYAISYAQNANPTLKELVGALSPTAAEAVPDGLTVNVKDAVLASDGTSYAFCVDLTATVDLSKLPVVGSLLHGDQVMGFDPLRVIAATGLIAAAEVAEIGKLLPSNITPLPAQDLTEGLTFDGVLRLGAFEQAVDLPVATGSGPAPPPAPAQPKDNVLWKPVQTDIGPLHIERVGLSYLHEPGQPALLAFLVDASLSIGGLTLSCTGLSAGISLADPLAVPTFDLAGLGLAYSEGPVQISGAFLKDKLVYGDRTYDAYNGKAVIKTETFTIGALGSYVQLDQGPSLFVYAFLDYPIGGPAFFFVRGIAAGFGYNRRLIAPPVDKLADFPLVAEAIGAQAPGTLAGELQRLEADLPPSPGDYFLALGVHFTSFEMIDSFLLVTAGFGHRFELNVLGVSTLVLPAPDAASAGVTPIAEIQLALKATLAPDDGFFSLTAQLTRNSYLLSQACRLTGGFAFVTWFGDEHHGDFVLTVGGYHPHFTVPDHYPLVPRLGFTWQVTDQLVLKGSAYYAMTPQALMAGGSLSATYEDGSLRAWFDTALDFLIAWQPYHYEAAFHLSVGASYTFWFFGTQTITVHVGTDVRFWGPEFGGTATIDLSIISFTISFGSASGASAQPVEYSRFRDAQLPTPDKIVTVVLRGGGVQPGQGADLGVVNPADLVLATDSAVPALTGTAGGQNLPGAARHLGVAPCGATATLTDKGVTGFTSTHQITITRDGEPAEQHFTFEPIAKDLPAAMWGDDLTPNLNKPALVENLLTGYLIKPVRATEPANQPSIPLADLQAATPAFTEHDAFDWTPLAEFTPTGGPADPGPASAVRTQIAGKLLPGLDLDLNGFTSADFLDDPQVAAHV